MSKKLETQLVGYRGNPERMRKDPTFPVFLEGVSRGKQAMQKAAIDFLQKRYLEDHARPHRNSPEGQALLKLTRELSAHMNSIRPEDLVAFGE